MAFCYQWHPSSNRKSDLHLAFHYHREMDCNSGHEGLQFGIGKVLGSALLRFLGFRLEEPSRVFHHRCETALQVLSMRPSTFSKKRRHFLRHSVRAGDSPQLLPSCNRHRQAFMRILAKPGASWVYLLIRIWLLRNTDRIRAPHKKTHDFHSHLCAFPACNQIPNPCNNPQQQHAVIKATAHACQRCRSRPPIGCSCK